MLCDKITFFGHANREALLEATVLTPVPRHPVYDARLLLLTRVLHAFLHAAPEKALQNDSQTKLATIHIHSKRHISSPVPKKVSIKLKKYRIFGTRLELDAIVAKSA